jgi:hypothetical protein
MSESLRKASCHPLYFPKYIVLSTNPIHKLGNQHVRSLSHLELLINIITQVAYRLIVIVFEVFDESIGNDQTHPHIVVVIGSLYQI